MDTTLTQLKAAFTRSRDADTGCPHAFSMIGIAHAAARVLDGMSSPVGHSWAWTLSLPMHPSALSSCPLLPPHLSFPTDSLGCSGVDRLAQGHHVGQLGWHTDTRCVMAALVMESRSLEVHGCTARISLLLCISLKNLVQDQRSPKRHV